MYAKNAKCMYASMPKIPGCQTSVRISQQAVQRSFLLFFSAIGQKDVTAMTLNPCRLEEGCSLFARFSVSTIGL